MDPLAEKYYSISPYAYCTGNPVRFIDPNGQDIWEVDSDGNIAYHERLESKDIIYKVSDVDANDASNRVKNEDGTDALVSFEKGTVTSTSKSVTTEDANGGTKQENITIFNVKGDNNAESLFNFMIAPKSNSVEWGHVQTGTADSENNLVGNMHDPSGSGMGNFALNYGYTMRQSDHNHPSGTEKLSLNDIKNAKDIQDKFPHATLNIYVGPQKPVPYNKNSPYIKPAYPGAHHGTLQPGINW